MANVTYLLGAGASAGALPIYKNFKERFKIFADLFNTNHFKSGLSPELLIELNNLSILLSCFLKDFEYHNTPDTIAKKLFHVGKSYSGLTLEKTKIILILFFLYEQIGDQKNSINDIGNLYYDISKDIIDKRYDVLLATLLKPIEKKFELLPNVKILTWNYDLQLEITCSKYKSTNISVSQDLLQSFPKVANNNTGFDLEKFSIIHLNGIAYASNLNDNVNDYVGSNISISPELARYLLSIYKDLNDPKKDKSFINLLSFAWEKVDASENISVDNLNIQKALDIASATEILVVIGYSFPIFNRIIDKAIIEKMNNIKKVYIQDSNPEKIESTIRNGFNICGSYKLNAEELLRSRGNNYFESDIPMELPIHLEKNPDQFVIPFELS